jgi:polyphosphate kinase
VNIQSDIAVAPARLFNRELSWLAFNRRVLEEATNASHPLLERLRFLSISGTNLDEFFTVRVAGLKGHQLQGVDDLSADGMTATQQLDAIAEEADSLVVAQQAEWILLREALGEQGLEVITEDELAAAEREWLSDHFREQILPVLTPQAIDPSHPFPFIPSGGFSLVFDLRRGKKAEPVVELLMIPSTLPRFVRLPGQKNYGSCRSRMSSAPISTGYSPGSTGSTPARSGSCATATSKCRRKRRISSVTSGARSSGAGAGVSSAWSLPPTLRQTSRRWSEKASTPTPRWSRRVPA